MLNTLIIYMYFANDDSFFKRESLKLYVFTDTERNVVFYRFINVAVSLNLEVFVQQG